MGTLGEAIAAARGDYGVRVRHQNGRRKLARDRLWALCRERDEFGKHFEDLADGGKGIMGRFERGELCPSYAQVVIFEEALGLASGALLALLPKADCEEPSKADLMSRAPATALGGLSRDLEPAQKAAQIQVASSAPRSQAAVSSRDWLSELGDIEPTIEAGVRAAPGSNRCFVPPHEADREDRDIKALRHALRAEKRLIMLSGEPFLGKKAKIKGLLRLLADPSDSLVYELARDGKPAERLPIRAWSARRLHYGELVARVHDFLQEYRDAGPGQEAVALPGAPGWGDERPLDALIESINVNFRDLPAVFIFTDVDAFGENHARNVVRDIGIEHLIRTLLDANKSSRIIITTTHSEQAGRRNHQLINFPQYQSISVDPPAIAAVRHFLLDDIRMNLSLEALHNHEATVRGDDLVSLAALINLTYRDQHQALPEAVVTAIERLPIAAADQRDAVRGDVYDQLAAAIAQRGLVHAVTLIAASEDGVRLDSLCQLLATWRQQDPAVADFPDVARLDAALDDFSTIAGHRFLRRSGIARYDPEEYDFRAVHQPRDPVWEIEPVVSMHLLAALRRMDLTLPARAHRLIAWIARERSQQKKVLMRGPIGSRAVEAGSRDIQCYVNLLASIIFEPGDHLDAEGPPLRLSEAEIFAIDDRFSPARALRFAVICLLKEDIDHDYRLTMVFDEDALRLELYLLLFQELGRVYTPEVEPLHLPATLPWHLTCGIFSPEEVLDVMSTVALSAFHAQRFDIVDQVVNLATEFANSHEAPLSSLKLSRLWCCKIDASVRRGWWTPGGGHQETLQMVSRMRREWFPDLVDAVPEARIPREDLSRQKAHLRLLVREAELTALVNQDRRLAAHLYRLVERIEAAIWTTAEHHDPVVLSGRVGRRYLQFLLQDPAVVTPLPVTEVQRQENLRTVRGLLSINKSRLRRFSGADRVGVMLDMARLSLVSGDYAEAQHYAVAAQRRAFSGSVSHGSKLDVFQVVTKTKLALVEKSDLIPLPAGLEIAKLLHEASTAIRNLRSVAQHLGYVPAEGMADLLEARWFLASDDHRPGATVLPDHYVEGAAKALGRADAKFNAIGQVNHSAVLERLRAEIEMRQKRRSPPRIRP